MPILLFGKDGRAFAEESVSVFTLCSSPLDYHPKIDLLAAAKTKWVSFPFAHVSSISREEDQDIPFLKLSLSILAFYLYLRLSHSLFLTSAPQAALRGETSTL